MHRESWKIDRTLFQFDEKGFGRAVYSARGPDRTYSLVAFANPLDNDQRTDRVIAEAWDASFVLYDGEPKQNDIDRLAICTPRQEAGRFEASELVLSRANRSLRLFDYVCSSLSVGVQPEIERLKEVGYLMRTTAVYGNGKFGVGDRTRISDRPELSGPFQAEMLAVYLIRCFTFDQVEHVARSVAPDRFVPLARDRKRFLGIGNATGLGMAPFLVTHPELIHRWVYAREVALARVRQILKASPEKINRFQELLARTWQHLHEWWVDDSRQQRNILADRSGIEVIIEWVSGSDSLLLSEDCPWDLLYAKTERALSIETQELLVSLLLEIYPELVDDLESELSMNSCSNIDARQSLPELKSLIEKNYQWALEIDFELPESQQHFWYTSENKLEPRYGNRQSEPGAEQEMPLAIGRDVKSLYQQLAKKKHSPLLAEFLLTCPQYRYVVRRVQVSEAHPYGEIQDNLVGHECRPLDLLRYKLAFFGASKFDPKSSLWTRITLFQGAPLPDEIECEEASDWSFSIAPSER
jgi:hypothetical protein